VLLLDKRNALRACAGVSSVRSIAASAPLGHYLRTGPARPVQVQSPSVHSFDPHHLPTVSDTNSVKHRPSAARLFCINRRCFEGMKPPTLQGRASSGVAGVLSGRQIAPKRIHRTFSVAPYALGHEAGARTLRTHPVLTSRAAVSTQASAVEARDAVRCRAADVTLTTMASIAGRDTSFALRGQR
jgi:hypothetical protein